MGIFENISYHQAKNQLTVVEILGLTNFVSLPGISPFFAVFSEQIGFSDDSMAKESTCNGGDIADAHSVPGLGRSPGGGNGNPLQYSCLEISINRVAYRATVHGVTNQSDMTEWLTLSLHYLLSPAQKMRRLS